MMDFISGVGQEIVATVVLAAAGLIIALILKWRVWWRLFRTVLRFRRHGISTIFLSRSEYVSERSVSVNEFIGSSKREFIYIGIYFSLATDQARIDQLLRELIARSVVVRMVLLDPKTSDETIQGLEKILAVAQNTLRARVVGALQHFRQFQDALAVDQRNRFDLRIHSFAMPFSAFLIDPHEPDSRMLVDIKWPLAGRENSTGMEFGGSAQEGSLYGTVRASFLAILAGSRIIE